jgi:hypothetical protein
MQALHHCQLDKLLFPEKENKHVQSTPKVTDMCFA